MDIRILGAHNIESKGSRYVSLLVDDVMAVDAGALTSTLTFPEQQKLKAVLLTHQHYDHVRDIPALGMNFLLHKNTIEIYCIQPVYDALAKHLLDDELYPDYRERPPEKPTFHFRMVEPGKAVMISNYNVLPVTVDHAVPTVGYQITSADGRVVFYTGDTGSGLAESWRQIAPQLLIMEITAPSRYEEFAQNSKHLTTALFKKELESFRELKGYLPKVVIIHLNPLDEKEIKAEVAAVAKSLNANIRVGHEGMLIHV